MATKAMTSEYNCESFTNNSISENHKSLASILKHAKKNKLLSQRGAYKCMNNELDKNFSDPLNNHFCIGKKDIEDMPIKQLNFLLSFGFYTVEEIEYIRKLRRNVKCKGYVRKSRKIQREMEVQMEDEVDSLSNEKNSLVEEKKALLQEIQFYKEQIRMKTSQQ